MVGGSRNPEIYKRGSVALALGRLNVPAFGTRCRATLLISRLARRMVSHNLKFSK
jgi:hypothetical protein